MLNVFEVTCVLQRTSPAEVWVKEWVKSRELIVRACFSISCRYSGYERVTQRQKQRDKNASSCIRGTLNSVNLFYRKRIRNMRLLARANVYDKLKVTFSICKRAHV